MEAYNYHQLRFNVPSIDYDGDLLLCISCSSSSSLDKGMVEWLYKPCAMSWSARGFFCPDAFLILARLFWNQIFIWASLSPNSELSCCRRLSVKYLFSANSCFNLANWAPEKAVRGRFSSGTTGFPVAFFGRLVLGPATKNNNDKYLHTEKY